jgi:hypothetical protein
LANVLVSKLGILALGFLAVRVKGKCFHRAAHSEAKVANTGLAAHTGRGYG